MKVFHVNYADHGGGAEAFATRLVGYQQSESILCVWKKKTSLPFVVEFRKNLFDHLFWLCGKGLRLFGLRKTARQLLGINDLWNFTFRKLKAMPEYQRADIVHLHNIHGGFFDIKAISQIAAEKPVIWSLHDMWALTGGEAYTFENENYLQGHHWTPYSAFFPMKSPGIDTRRFCLALKKEIYDRAGDKLTMVCDALWLTNRVERSWVHSSKNKIRTINLGIDIKTFRNMKKRNWVTPRIVVVNTGNPFKGSDLLGQIFGEIKTKFDLTVVGSAPEFHTKAGKTVVHPYFRDVAALQDVFNTNDLFIFPSKAEIFPLTVLIAMACGLCVAASDVGGISEAIVPGCGVLLDQTNPTKCGKIIESMLFDLGEIRAIGLRASERIHKRFSEEATFKQYEELYREVITRQPGPLNPKAPAE